MQQKVFKKADRFIVMTAEFSVHLLNFFSILFWKLQTRFVIELETTNLMSGQVSDKRQANLLEQDVSDLLY